MTFLLEKFSYCYAIKPHHLPILSLSSLSLLCFSVAFLCITNLIIPQFPKLYSFKFHFNSTITQFAIQILIWVSNFTPKRFIKLRFLLCFSTMDRNFFLNAGLHFELPSQLPSWKLMSSVPETNEQSYTDRFNNFESNFSSPVSSVSPVSNSVAQKINWPIMDNLVKQNTSTLRNSIPFDTNLPSLPTDPGFAERAAKFSCFGSRSFNGRTSQLRSNALPLIGHSNLPRVSSSPSLKINGSTMMIQDNKISPGSGYDNKTSSNEESSVSEQMEISNSRKRKAASLKGKAKDIVSVVVKVTRINNLFD